LLSSVSPIIEVSPPTSGPPLVETDSILTSLDPMLLVDSAVPAGDSLLAGLTIEAPPAMLRSNDLQESDQPPSSSLHSAANQGNAVVAAHAELDALMAETANKKEKKDAFNFVGDELIKAQSSGTTA